MTLLTAGVDTYCLAAEPNLAHNGQASLQVAKDAAVAYVFLPITLPPGAVVTSAILRLYAYGAWPSSTVTAQAAAGSWGGYSTTWNNQPGGTGAVATLAKGPAVDGDEFAITVTSQVSAQLATGTNFGFVIARTDTNALASFYSAQSTRPPILDLTYTLAPVPPTNLRPSGGRAVATNKPILRFDCGGDVTSIQVQLDVAGTFATPEFDSGTVAAVSGEYDLSTSGYTGLPGSTAARYWRAQYKTAAGPWSGWSAPASMCFRPLPTVTLTNPSAAGSWIVGTDTPTITWNTTGGTQVAYQVKVAAAADPYTTRYDSKRQPGTLASQTVPPGTIQDSASQILTLEVADSFDREAVPGFGTTALVQQAFSFQENGSVPPPDSLTATQLGLSPFVVLQWTRSQMPDKWVIRRDGEIILSVAASDVTLDQSSETPTYSWTDYTASGNSSHHYRVTAKVGDNVSSGGPTADILTKPAGLWLGDPYRQTSVFLTGDNAGTWSMGEDSTMYYPLRGADPVKVTQALRGYEGSHGGRIVSLPGQPSPVAQYNALMFMRNNPDRPYVLAGSTWAINATLSHIVGAPARTTETAFDVTFDYAQQGETLWRVAQGFAESTTTLLKTLTFEEGVNGAPVTTASPYVDNVLGAPTYKAAAAIHGSMGFTIPASGSGGLVSTSAPVVGQADVYFTPRVSVGGATVCRVDSSSGRCFIINARLNGDWDISDQTNTLVIKSHGTAGWQLNVKCRLSVQWTWINGTVWVLVRVYNQPESSYPNDEFGASFPCTNAPSEFLAGNGNAQKSTDYDSIRVYAGNSTWPAPLQPSAAATPIMSTPGIATSTTHAVSSLVYGGATLIDLAYSTTLTGNDPASPSYAGVATVDSNGLVKHNLSSLAPNTTYYAKLATGPGLFVGDIIKLKTLPAPATAFTYKAAVGSCQGNQFGSVTQLAWIDALAWSPDMLMHLGDVGYWGQSLSPTDPWTKHLEKYRDQIIGLTAQKQMLAQAGSFLPLADDHEFSKNNGDSNAATDTGKVRAASIAAMQRVFALYPLADTRPVDQKRSLHGTFMLGSRVRVIVLDGESLDRSLQSDSDSAAKTFLGAEQDAWLRTLLRQPAVVNILVTGKTLIGTGSSAGTDADKPWTYPTWRSSLTAYINGTLTTDGKAINVLWLGGDRHANAYASKAGNTTMPGHPTVCASGWEQHSLKRATDETYTADYGFDDNTKRPVVQYVQMTVTDNNSNQVSIRFLSREVHGTWDSAQGKPTDAATWALVNGFDVTETWAY